MNKPKQIIKAQFKNRDGVFAGKEYSFASSEIYAVGDILMVNTLQGERTVCVTQAGISEEECGFPVDKLAWVVGRKSDD